MKVIFNIYHLSNRLLVVLYLNGPTNQMAINILMTDKKVGYANSDLNSRLLCTVSEIS